MTDSDTVAESAGEAASAIVESAIEQVQTTVENLEQRVEAADELNEVLTEAAMRDKIVQRVDDLQEQVDEWHEDLTARAANVETQLAAQSLLIAELQQQMTERQPITVTVPLTPPTSEAETILPAPPQEPETVTVTINPDSAENTPAEIPPTKPRRWI